MMPDSVLNRITTDRKRIRRLDPIEDDIQNLGPIERSRNNARRPRTEQHRVQHGRVDL